MAATRPAATIMPRARSGAMTLRSAALGANGVQAGCAAVEVDARVCDCCQTDAAVTDDGPVRRLP